MQAKLNYQTAAPKAFKTVYALENFVVQSGIEKQLLHLIKLRASQINGYAFCIDMHSKEARKDGESEQRLYLFSAWCESPLFTEKERAALAWTEAITLLTEYQIDDELFEELQQHFSEEEMVNLFVEIGTINIWNRLNVGFGTNHPVKEPLINC